MCSVRKTIRIAGDDYPAEPEIQVYEAGQLSHRVCYDIIGNYPKRRARRCQSLCVRRSFLCLPHWKLGSSSNSFRIRCCFIFVNGQLVDHGGVVFDHFLFCLAHSSPATAALMVAVSSNIYVRPSCQPPIVLSYSSIPQNRRENQRRKDFPTHFKARSDGYLINHSATPHRPHRCKPP